MMQTSSAHSELKGNVSFASRYRAYHDKPEPYEVPDTSARPRILALRTGERLSGIAARRVARCDRKPGARQRNILEKIDRQL
jgi:hypothetical protein